MIISLYCLITSIAEGLPTVYTYHLVTTINSGNRHFTSWALLSITKYFLETKNLIDQFRLLSFLLVIQLPKKSVTRNGGKTNKQSSKNLITLIIKFKRANRNTYDYDLVESAYKNMRVISYAVKYKFIGQNMRQRKQ